MGVIRASCLLNFRELVRDLGFDGDPILSQAGIRPQHAGDHDVFLSYRSVVVVIEEAARLTATPDFGRRLAARQGFEILGAVGVAARTSGTVGEALRTYGKYMSVYSPAIAVQLGPMPNPRFSFLELQVLPVDLPPYQQTMELSLGIALCCLRALLGADYRPLNVHVPHDPITGAEPYWQYFGCEARFSTRTAGFTLRTADLEQKLSGDAHAHEVILRYLESLSVESESSMSATVRHLVRQLAPTGAVTLRQVALQFALHPKAFQRRLAQEGTTFETLVDQTRMAMCERYLRDTDLGLHQVSRELGYAEQSVLTRACHRWYGSSPTALRALLRLQGSEIRGSAAITEV